MLSVPGKWRDVQGQIGGVENDLVALATVIERHSATAVHADKELVQRTVTVVAAGLTRGNRLDAPESPGLERQMRGDLTPHEGSAGVANRRESRQPSPARPKLWEIDRCRANHGRFAPTMRLNSGAESVSRRDGPDARCAGWHARQTRMGT
jgi:hypothetical protein